MEKQHASDMSARSLDDHVHATKADIAARLRHIRRHHPEGPLSLAKLADLAGVSKRTLGSVESAEGANVTIETRVKVAHSLGIQRCAYFLDGQVFEQVNKELELIQELRRGRAHGLAMRASHAAPVATTTDQVSRLLTGIIDAAAQARDSLRGTPQTADEEKHVSGPQPPTSTE
ncbi:helix-turn-helix domain-containing protein [Streptomyces piniterrae]|uniref:helix-turn-helix domain-containing protein n=1 Tax=Streptomyces piniterrae TaxID=2571125 RepID=UPI001651B730|nr:helix-turn-helix domain-containing protein [Streptomyces piniterrae]